MYSFGLTLLQRHEFPRAFVAIAFAQQDDQRLGDGLAEGAVVRVGPLRRVEVGVDLLAAFGLSSTYFRCMTPKPRCRDSSCAHMRKNALLDVVVGDEFAHAEHALHESFRLHVHDR